MPHHSFSWICIGFFLFFCFCAFAAARCPCHQGLGLEADGPERNWPMFWVIMQTETGDQKQTLRWAASQCAGQDSWFDEWGTEWRKAGVWEVSRCSLGARRLKGTELSLYPLRLSLSQTAHQIAKGFRGIFRGSMWRCWTEWDLKTLYPLLAAHQVACWGWWRLSDYFV